MKKSRAVISLLLVAAITCLMAYTVLIGFGKGHRGSYHNIKKGLDLAGGASITYQAVGEQPPSQEDLNDTKYKLQRRVDQYSTEAQVYTSWRIWAVPVRCTSSARRMQRVRKTISSVSPKKAALSIRLPRISTRSSRTEMLSSPVLRSLMPRRATSRTIWATSRSLSP